MITYISPREAELSRQIDEQGGHLVAWRDRAIAAEAELARLRAQEPVAPPGWREREAEMHRRLMERVPLRCSPTLTECPRCKNNIFKCDGLSPCRASCGGAV